MKKIYNEKYREYYERQPSKRPYTSAQLKEVINNILEVNSLQNFYLFFIYDF